MSTTKMMLKSSVAGYAGSMSEEAVCCHPKQPMKGQHSRFEDVSTSYLASQNFEQNLDAMIQLSAQVMDSLLMVHLDERNAYGNSF